MNYLFYFFPKENDCTYILSVYKQIIKINNLECKYDQKACEMSYLKKSVIHNRHWKFTSWYWTLRISIILFFISKTYFSIKSCKTNNFFSIEYYCDIYVLTNFHFCESSKLCTFAMRGFKCVCLHFFCYMIIQCAFNYGWHTIITKLVKYRAHYFNACSAQFNIFLVVCLIFFNKCWKMVVTWNTPSIFIFYLFDIIVFLIVIYYNLFCCNNFS